MVRAAIYTRVSNPEQGNDGNGLEAQMAACLAHAAVRGYDVVATYREVRTGRDLGGRRHLGELRALVRSGHVDVVVAHAVDRLTRDVAHLHFLMVEAEAAGATIEFVAEELSDTPEGKLLQAVRGFVAEVERLRIGERSKLGIRARVDRGQYHVGSLPYGYRWRDDAHDALEPDDTNSSVVRRIFAEVARGSSIGAVIRRLDEDRIATPRHGRIGWNERTIAAMLRNPIYKGAPHAYRWRKKARDGVGEIAGYGWDTWEPAPPEEWVPLPAEVAPPLVAADTWEAANAWLAANRTNSAVDHAFPDTYLLSGGVARCGVCGRPLLGRGRRAPKPYYRCAGLRNDPRPCSKLRRDAAILDGRVWARVLRTAARGGPRERRQVSSAGILVWLDDGGASRARTVVEQPVAGAARSPGDPVSHDGDVAAEATDPSSRDNPRSLAEQVRQVEAVRASAAVYRARLAAIREAWADLARSVDDDAAGLADAPFRQRRAWLERLGIAVRVWPRGYGRLLEVAAAVDPSALSSGDLPALCPAAAARAKTGTVTANHHPGGACRDAAPGTLDEQRSRPVHCGPSSGRPPSPHGQGRADSSGSTTDATS